MKKCCVIISSSVIPTRIYRNPFKMPSHLPVSTRAHYTLAVLKYLSPSTAFCLLLSPCPVSFLPGLPYLSTCTYRYCTQVPLQTATVVLPSPKCKTLICTYCTHARHSIHPFIISFHPALRSSDADYLLTPCLEGMYSTGTATHRSCTTNGCLQGRQRPMSGWIDRWLRWVSRWVGGCEGWFFLGWVAGVVFLV